MAEFGPGSRFDVTEEKIELYYEGELTEFNIDYVEINSIDGDSVEVSHYGEDPRLPITETVTVSDVADALGDWLKEE